MQAIEIVRFCSNEVYRQGRDARFVTNMVEAWYDAISRHESGRPITCVVISKWGQIIEPNKNNGESDFRTGQVFVGGHIPPPAKELHDLMKRYVENFVAMMAEEAYLEFERIHPFWDGNGRVGKILLAWKLDKLLKPMDIIIPNPWKIANP